jgi:hypothetical protein
MVNKTSEARLRAQKAYRQRHLEQCRQRDRERYYKNRERLLDFTVDQKARRSRANRIFRLKRDYGITPEQYEEMLVHQNGVCAICGNPDKHGRNLAVDHSHETGKVRGLLCTHCNTGIGVLGDTADHLRAALKYLENQEGFVWQAQQ